MNRKGVPKPTQALLRALQEDAVLAELARWLSLATDASVKARSYSPSVAPGTVNAGVEKSVAVTVEGITANDIVVVQKPTKTTDISVTDAIPSADTVTIYLRNYSGGNIAVPTETYTIFAIRA